MKCLANERKELSEVKEEERGVWLCCDRTAWTDRGDFSSIKKERTFVLNNFHFIKQHRNHTETGEETGDKEMREKKGEGDNYTVVDSTVIFTACHTNCLRDGVQLNTLKMWLCVSFILRRNKNIYISLQ